MTGSGCQNTSNCAIITVIPDPIFTTQPQNTTICEGGQSTLSVVVSGGTGTTSFQWQTSSTGCSSGWSDIAGAITDSYTTPVLTSTTYYRCIATQTISGCQNTSNCATVTVVADPVFDTQPLSTTICAGGQTTFYVSVSGGTGTTSYQWQTSSVSCASGWSDIPGATNSSYTTPFINIMTYYRCIATQTGSGCQTTSNCATVTVLPGPNITTQPQSTTICEGGQALLSVVISGGVGLITYQWQLSNTGCGSGWTNIIGATNSSYTTDVLNTTTYYQCVISISGSGCNSLITNCATITVVPDPKIITQPLSTTICMGGQATLTVADSGGVGTSSYQWQSSNIGCGSGWSNISGASSTSYTTPVLNATTYYRCIVSQTGSGCQSTSNCATVTVVSDPTFTTQPQNSTICSGGQSTLSVVVSGGTGTTSYQWQSSIAGCGSGWGDIIGATNDSYTTPILATTTYYRCIASQTGSGCQSTSNCGTVTVVPDPTIAAQPLSTTVCIGGQANLSVVVSGGTGTISYQWQISTTDCSSGWFDIPGATNSLYTTSALNSTTYFRCNVSQSGSGCNSLTSNCAIITVIPVPVFSTQPIGDTVCTGGTASMNISISGGFGTPSFQWQLSTTDCASGWADIPGATSTTYNTTTLTTTTYYHCIVTQTGSGCQNISACATVTVLADPVFTLQPHSDTICTGGSSTLSIAVSGGHGANSYQWQSSSVDCNSGWSNIVGATTTTYSTPVLTATQYYRCIVTQPGSGCQAVSNCATITVIPDPIFTENPANSTICTGGDATLSVVVSGGVGTTTYQWQSSITGCGSGWSDIIGANNQTYTTPILTSTTYYQCIVTMTGSGCQSTSNCATITVVPDPIITTQPISTTICTGTHTTLTVAASGGTGTFIYQWQSSTNGCGSGWTNIPGANNATYTTSNITDTTFYQCIISQTGSGCAILTSACARVGVIISPNANFTPFYSGNCSPLLVQFNNQSLGDSINYIWDFGNGIPYSNLQNPPPVTYYQGINDTSYIVTLTVGNICGTNIHQDTILVLPKPVVDFHMSQSSGCSPVNISFIDDITGFPTTMTWNFGDGTTPIISTSFNTPIPHTFYNLSQNDTIFTVTLIASNNCGSDTISYNVTIHPNTVTAFFNTVPTIGCAPLTVNFTNFSTVGTTPSWSFGDGNSSTAWSPSHVYTNAGHYIVTLAITNGCSIDTAYSDTIIVNATSVVDFTFNNNICAEDTVFFVNATSGAINFLWDFGDGSPSSNLSNPNHIYDSSGVYQVTLTVVNQNTCTSSITKPVSVIFYPHPYFTATPNPICSGNSVVFGNQTDSLNSNTYIWNFNNGSSSTDINPIPQIFNNPGNLNDVTYNVILTATHQTCTNTFTSQITVHPLPLSDFTTYDSIFCNFGAPAYIQFMEQTVGSQGFKWYIGNNSVSTQQDPLLHFADSGSYPVSLVVTNQYQCKDSTTKTYTIYSDWEAVINVIPTSGCEPLGITFTSSISNLTYLWNFGDGSSSNQANTYHVYQYFGDYPVSVYITGNGGCKDSLIYFDSINVYPRAIAGFTYQNINSDGSVLFTNTSQYSTTFDWSFGDGATFYGFDTIHRYWSNTYFQVVLTANNIYNCPDTLSKQIIIDFLYGLYIPNAFSPSDNNPLVQKFQPVGIGLRTYLLQIYDTWGNLIWETSALDAYGRPTEAWDGGNLPVDSYIWKANAVYINGSAWMGMKYGNVYKTSGTVTILR